MKRGTQKILIGMLGWAVLLLGLVMIPYPGPGWLVVFLGLSILAREFVWAKRVNAYARGRYDDWRVWMRQQPNYIKAIFWMLTCTTVVVTLWLLNGYGLMNEWLNLDQDWVRSPFVK